MSTPEAPTSAEALLRTVGLQAETIHLQAQTIADLTEQLVSMAALDDPPGAGRPRYLDGSDDD